MANLTKKMREVLLTADIERGMISDVPFATVHGLVARGLVDDSQPSKWAHGVPKHGGQSSGAGRFPHYNGLRLTAAGVQIARSLQGESDKRRP
jgi:hypothetical protein